MAGQDLRHEWCRAESSDGYKCVLFKHGSNVAHRSKHLAHKWTDDDQKAVKHTEFIIGVDFDEYMILGCEDCSWEYVIPFMNEIKLTELNKVAKAHTEDMQAKER